MGSPQGRHIETQHQEFYLDIEIEDDSRLHFTNSSLVLTLEYLEIATYKLLLRSPAKSSEICSELTPVRAQGEAALSARD
jgi:hypothetical protein